jgi:hypothetical protein
VLDVARGSSWNSTPEINVFAVASLSAARLEFWYYFSWYLPLHRRLCRARNCSDVCLCDSSSTSKTISKMISKTISKMGFKKVFQLDCQNNFQNDNQNDFHNDLQ